MGHKKPSPRELEKVERDRKMAHYYYHCERNPAGFARIKVENLEKDIENDFLTKASQLALKDNRFS